MSSPSSLNLEDFPCGKSFGVRVPSPNVLVVELKTNKLNTLTKDFWTDIKILFNYIGNRTDCVRCVVLTTSTQSKIFTAGLDLMDHSDLFANSTSDMGGDAARRSRQFKSLIINYQEGISSVENIPQPVICSIDGPCIGGGVDLILSADIRVSTEISFYSIAEVSLGLAADVGTLQRIEKCVGNSSAVREWVYSGKKFSASEALSFGLISKSYRTREDMDKATLELASTIASKSPIAVYGSKQMLNYSRDHSIRESLEMMALWNSIHLQTEDLPTAAAAMTSKSKSNSKILFAKL